MTPLSLAFIVCLSPFCDFPFCLHFGISSTFQGFGMHFIFTFVKKSSVICFREYNSIFLNAHVLSKVFLKCICLLNGIKN